MKLLQLIVQLSSLVGMVVSYDDLGLGLPTDAVPDSTNGSRNWSIEADTADPDVCATACAGDAGFMHDTDGSNCLCWQGGIIGTLQAYNSVTAEVYGTAPATTITLTATSRTYCFECREPSLQPSDSPSLKPSAQPSLKPSAAPSLAPSESPSLKPSAQPSLKPSAQPSRKPSLAPSESPSLKPSAQPSLKPSLAPSESPSLKPSASPSVTPTKEPSETPSSQPSTMPSGSPSSMPSSIPSESPSSIPSENPSSQPSSIPSENPSSQPSSIPSESPSSIPSENPSSQPSSIPSESPSSIPSENPSIQPSSIPSESPSSIPSENPSSQPSETPSISSKPTVTSSPSSTVGHVKTAGGFSINAPLCNLNVTATDRVVRALNEALMGAGCPIKDPSCTAHTLSICKKPPNISFVQDPYAPPLTQSTRNLQQSTRHLLEMSEVGFEIIAAVECKNAACTTDGDIATSKDIADKITQRINAAIQSGVVAGVIANALSLDCLVAWGGITSPSVSSKFVSEGSLSKVGVAIPTSGTFYPDWYGKSGSCINDGNAPTYMQLKPSQWIYDNLDACCDRYYSGYEKPKCMNGQGSGLWVVDWDDERCSLDCAVSTGGLCAGTVGGTVTKYSDPLTCCKKQLPWVSSEFCQYDSLRTNDNCYDGTKKYYSNDKTCVKDCKTGSPGCGGLVSEPHVQLYPSIDTCCAAQFSWVTRGLCVSRSSSTTTDQYWADKGKSKCVKDSVTPATDLTVVLYPTAKECCKSITWVTSAACVAGSN